MASVAPDHTSLVQPRGRKRKETSKPEGKRFVCSNEGCGRSFTRAEHLQRHLLNHSTGEYTCERCRAHFKRRDLLGKNAGYAFIFRLYTGATILHVLQYCPNASGASSLFGGSSLARTGHIVAAKFRMSHPIKFSVCSYFAARLRTATHRVCKTSHCYHMKGTWADEHAQTAI